MRKKHNTIYHRAKKIAADATEELNDIVAKVQNSLDMWVAFLTRYDLLNKDKS